MGKASRQRIRTELARRGRSGTGRNLCEKFGQYFGTGRIKPRGLSTQSAATGRMAVDSRSVWRPSPRPQGYFGFLNSITSPCPERPVPPPAALFFAHKKI